MVWLSFCGTSKQERSGNKLMVFPQVTLVNNLLLFFFFLWHGNFSTRKFCKTSIIEFYTKPTKRDIEIKWGKLSPKFVIQIFEAFFFPPSVDEAYYLKKHFIMFMALNGPQLNFYPEKLTGVSTFLSVQKTWKFRVVWRVFQKINVGENFEFLLKFSDY